MNQRTLAPARALHVPSSADTDLAILAVRSGRLNVPDARRALDLQEVSGERATLSEILEREGMVDGATLREVGAERTARRAEARGIFFARAVAALGRGAPFALDELRLGPDGSTFDDRLVASGVLTASARDRLLADFVRTGFAAEDGLFARAALLVRAASRRAIEDAVGRQHWLAAQGKAPLPLHTLLVGASAVDARRGAEILRAVRRHRITGDPIRRYVSATGWR